MCGRFTLTVDPTELAQLFAINEFVADAYEKSYNIAPSQKVLSVIESKGKRKAGLLQWGLIPRWADPTKMKPFINARSETLNEKRSFRHLNRNRCVILADSFYEWKREDGKKKPIRFMLNDGKPFAFAGLWDRYQREGQTVYTCTIITTPPNQLVESVHNRMPAILDDQSISEWLSPENREWSQLQALLKPYAAEKMKKYEVSSIVNSPKNNSVECIKPL